MLKNRSISFALGLSSIVLFMSSCSMMNSEFSKQKYTKFKVHHDANTVAVNPGQDRIRDNKNTMETTLVSNSSGSVSTSDAVQNKVSKETSVTHSRAYNSINKEVEKMPAPIQLITLKKEHSDMKRTGKRPNRPTDNFVLLVLCFLLPPLAVYIERGLGRTFWFNILFLIIFLWLGGVIHALYTCFFSSGGGRGQRG